MDSSAQERVTSVTSETSRKRSLALYSAAFILAILVWYVVLHDPLYQGMLRRMSFVVSPPPSYSLPDGSIHEAQDPAIGAPLPNTGLAAEIRAKMPRDEQGYLLAALGDCSSCSTLDLRKLYKQTKERGISLLAISTGDDKKMKQLVVFYRREGMDIPFFQDADNKLSAAINSYYPGRLYYYTSDWKLRWREQDMGIDNYLFSTGRFDRILENTQP